MFVEILQNSQESTCDRVSLLKNRLWHRCFLANFMKFLGTPFFTEHLRWLLLNRFFLKKICKYTIKPPQISTFSPDKYKIKEIIHTSALLLPKTGKATKKLNFSSLLITSSLPHYFVKDWVEAKKAMENKILQPEAASRGVL